MATFMLMTLALAASVVQDSSALRLPFAKRDNTTVPPLQTLPMPLKFDSQGRYNLLITMSTSQPQNFTFTISTGSGLTYVAGQSCSDCTNTALYNQGASSSAVSLSGSDNTTFFGESSSGTLLKENCGALLENGSFWAYPNQTVVNVNSQTTQSSNAIFSNNVSGIFGLGTNRASNGSSGIGFMDSIYGQWFPRNPAHSNFTFGMMLNPPQSSPQAGSDAGVIHWTKPDSSFFDPNQVALTTVQDNAASSTSGNTSTTPGQDWTVPLSGWAAVVGNTHLSNTNGVVATVDPLYPNIYLPGDQARLIHDAINGSSPAPANMSTLGSASQAFNVPCDAQYTFALLVGSQSFILNPDSLIIRHDDGTCTSGIEGFTDSSQTQYLVGARFIGTVYLIFNIPLDGSPTLGFSPRVTPSHSSTNVGAIVGGTVGGVAFVIICGLVAFWYLRKRADRWRGPFEIEDTDKPMQQTGVEPFMLGAPTPAQPSTMGTSSDSDYSGTSMPSSQPLLESHARDNNGGMMPPTYEEASSSGSPVSTRPPPVRDVKHQIPRVRVPSTLTESVTSPNESVPGQAM